MQTTLELADREKCLLFSMQHSIGRLFTGEGSRMWQSLILIDALSSACWEEKKKKHSQGLFPPGLEA
jgi:hypothetical protein